MKAAVATEACRCLIVEDETLVALGLQAALAELGHSVVGQARDAAEAEIIFRARQPDLVLTDIRLGGMDGLDLASLLLKIRACPVIVVSAFSDKDLIERAGQAGVFGYLIKPVTSRALAAQIEIALARFREHFVLVAEKEALVANLENRKLVERAKGVLMKRSGLSEPDAHKKLQQESQKRRISVVDLARKIIESEEIIGGISP
ncbi:MAG: response regulator [Planctomycetota bacterium]|nr:response regulator [Planctomycetota bacterium]